MRRRPQLARAMLAAGSSAAAVALYSRVAWPWCALGWVMLVPWLAHLDGVRTPRAALAAGFLMSEAMTLAVFWWFGLAVARYAALPPAAGLVLLAVAAPLLQPQPMALALAGAGAYVGCEWLVPKLLGDTLGHGLLPAARLRQMADLVGAPGLTLLLVCGNEAVLAGAAALGARAPRRLLAPALALAALVGVPALYGGVRRAEVEAASAAAEPLAVAIVQGGIGDYGALRARYGTFEATEHILGDYEGLSRRALGRERVQLLVWPETVYPTTFGAPKSPDGAETDRELARFVRGAGVPLVFGAYDADGDREFNAAILLEPGPDGRAVTFDAYRKTWLFPLTERVPPWLDHPWIRRRLPWLGTWSAGGPGPAVLVVRPPAHAPVPIAPQVCYDAVFPGHLRRAAAEGASLVVTLSNDAWFDRGPGTRLHLAVAAFGSIETHRPQVRATTTGLSAVIDATGELRQVAPARAPAVLVEAVRPVVLPPTLVMRWGDWTSPAALLAALVLALWPAAAYAGSRRR